MRTTGRRTTDEQELERELLRQGVDGRAADQPRCCECGRTPLIGERIATYAAGETRCELCAELHHARPAVERLVRHQPDGPHARVRVIRRLPV